MKYFKHRGFFVLLILAIAAILIACGPDAGEKQSLMLTDLDEAADSPYRDAQDPMPLPEEPPETGQPGAEKPSMMESDSEARDTADPPKAEEPAPIPEEPREKGY